MTQSELIRNIMAANEAAGADLLVSNEKLTSDSPVMWPDHNFCKLLLSTGNKMLYFLPT